MQFVFELIAFFWIVEVCLAVDGPVKGVDEQFAESVSLIYQFFSTF